MTKTAERVIEAWDNRSFCHINNTSTDGKVVYLYGNKIIKRENGKVYIRTAGYATKTTKDRLNSLKGVHVYTSKGIVYLNNYEWDNHKEWTEI